MRAIVIVHRYETYLDYSWKTADCRIASHGCSRREIRLLEKLLNSKAEIDHGAGKQGTPLFFAASEGHLKIMERLIGRGADINATVENFGPVINAAIMSGDVKAVQKLLGKGVKLKVEDEEDGISPLELSAAAPDITMLELLLAAKSNDDVESL